MPEFPKGASEMRSSPSFFPFALSDRAEEKGETKIKHLKIKISFSAIISQKRTSLASSMKSRSIQESQRIDTVCASEQMLTGKQSDQRHFCVLALPTLV
jgi:hypothetical protein